MFKFSFFALLILITFSCSNAKNESYPIYTTPNYPRYYQEYNRPSSGLYRNPYNQPPRNYYPYYDYDYYYVPPTDYRNIEPDFRGGPDTNKY